MSMTPEEYAALTKRASDWLAKPEAQQKLREARDNTARAIKELEEVRRVTWQELHEPFTI